MKEDYFRLDSSRNARYRFVGRKQNNCHCYRFQRQQLGLVGSCGHDLLTRYDHNGRKGGDWQIVLSLGYKLLEVCSMHLRKGDEFMLPIGVAIIP